MADNSNNSSTAPGDNPRFEELGRGCYAYSADGCSNTGVIVGERGVLIVDAQATPAQAENVLEKIREKTDKPVKVLALTHFHADSTLGASAFDPGEVIASDLTRRMIDTRGHDEFRLASNRFPDLFAGLPGNTVVTSPTMTIASSMSIDLGGLEVRLMHLGRGHTMGDLVAWVPSNGVIFAGDLVQLSAAPYCGDAHLADWPRALDRITAFRPSALMPGRGRSAIGSSAVATAIETTRDFVTTLRDGAAACVDQGLGLRDTFLAVKDALEPQFGTKKAFAEHLPFNVARAYDEALGLDQPQLWTLERSADLQDAISVAIEELPAGSFAQEEDPMAAQPETDGETDALPDDGSDERDLVSDSDFAASLALGSEEEALDLSADDIVPEEEAVAEDAEDREKAFADARA
ncbi:MBL fold metallo-hydrolase [Roseibium aggregatum]|uniref:MBL fold metallo-hydrolase n=1 Tax=Roseibium aggregatum TaxID=187304 RepID=A0A939EB43_9HYPH|nr:MBL fold metallo-hydrolase [Roseibium aggregatum]MBN9669947.1 MBL fold metallo-hydrolase [Roseibium aggregatum]